MDSIQYFWVADLHAREGLIILPTPACHLYCYRDYIHLFSLLSMIVLLDNFVCICSENFNFAVFVLVCFYNAYLKYVSHWALHKFPVRLLTYIIL